MIRQCQIFLHRSLNATSYLIFAQRPFTSLFESEGDFLPVEKICGLFRCIHSRVLLFLAAITFKSHTDDGERGIEISGPDWMGGGKKKEEGLPPFYVHRGNPTPRPSLRPTILWSQNNPSPPPFCLHNAILVLVSDCSTGGGGGNRQTRERPQKGRTAGLLACE